MITENNSELRAALAVSRHFAYPGPSGRRSALLHVLVEVTGSFERAVLAVIEHATFDEFLEWELGEERVFAVDGGPLLERGHDRSYFRWVRGYYSMNEPPRRIFGVSTSGAIVVNEAAAEDFQREYAKVAGLVDRA